MRGRRDGLLRRLFVLVALILPCTVASGQRESHYAGNESRIRLDEEAAAQLFDFQPTIGLVGPHRRARCSVYAGVSGVPVTASATLVDVFGEGAPLSMRELDRTTRADGWTEPFVTDAPAGEDTLALLWNAALEGESGADEAFTQCSFGTPKECVPSDTTACISVGGKNRFEATLMARHASDGAPQSAGVVGATDDGAIFRLPASNTEVVVEVIDACAEAPVNAFLVSYERVPDVELTLFVTDTEAGAINRFDSTTTSSDLVSEAPVFDTCP